MRNRKRVAGLCLLLALVGGAAMASTATSAPLKWWWKNPTTGTIEAIPTNHTVSLKASATTSFYLQTESTPRRTIECTGIAFVGGEAFNGGLLPTGIGKGKIKYTGCKNHEECLNPLAEFETKALEFELGVELKPNANRRALAFSNLSGEFAVVECNNKAMETTVTMHNNYVCELDATVAAAETIKASHPLVCITKRNLSPWCEKPVEEYEDGHAMKQVAGLNAFGSTAILCGSATVTMNEGATNIEWAVR